MARSANRRNQGRQVHISPSVLGLAALIKRRNADPSASVGGRCDGLRSPELMEVRKDRKTPVEAPARLQTAGLAKYHLLDHRRTRLRAALEDRPAELLFLSQRYERGSILVTSNLPFDEWTEIFGSRLTGALLDRLTHHPELNGESYRLNGRKSPKIPGVQWLTRWVHRNLPRCFAPRNASATRSSAGPSYGLPGQPPNTAYP